jgi:hypothetical protein
MINDFEGYINTIKLLIEYKYDVVPHIPVKSLSQARILYILELCKNTKNKSALILWWDKSKVVDYTSTLNFMENNKEALGWMKKIYFAWHPRAIWKYKNITGHLTDLEQRVEFCNKNNLDYGILTQLEFSRNKVLKYMSLLEGKNIDIKKVTLWMTSTRDLWEMKKYAQMCWFSKKDMVSFTPCIIPMLLRQKDISYKGHFFDTHLYSFWGIEKIISYLKKASS